MGNQAGQNYVSKLVGANAAAGKTGATHFAHEKIVRKKTKKRLKKRKEILDVITKMRLRGVGKLVL